MRYILFDVVSCSVLDLKDGSIGLDFGTGRDFIICVCVLSAQFSGGVFREFFNTIVPMG